MEETVPLCSATLCVRHSSCYQLAIWKNIFPVVAGARQRGGWLSSGAATCLVLALIWRGGNGDLTALPQKSAPSDTRKRDLPSHPPASPRCRDTRTQSQKEQSIRAHTCSSGLSARIYVTGSLHVESDVCVGGGRRRLAGWRLGRRAEKSTV